MKRNLLNYVFLFTALLVGCSDDNNIHPDDGRIWDFPNPDVLLFVQNSGRENLLDRRNENNILDNDIYIEYNGETYRLGENNRTRAIFPNWYGLRIVNVITYKGDDGNIAICFGEFQTMTNGYHGETFMVFWGDGTSDEVSFDLYITWAWNKEKEYNEPTVHKAIWVNGEQQSDNLLAAVIVK